MKKTIAIACALCLVSGLWVGNTFSDTPIMPIDIQISPHTIIHKAPVNWLTVHTDISYSSVDKPTVEIRNENGDVVGVAWTKSDSRGNLVAKFHMAEVEEIVGSPEATLTLTGYRKDGIPFEGSDTVLVKE